MTENTTNYLTAHTTISAVEPLIDKNNNRYFRVNVDWWNDNSRIFYAFATDYSLQVDTLQILTICPETIINRQVTITYEELENRNSGYVFARIKAIQLVR